jgi:hypothetical protein
VTESFNMSRNASASRLMVIKDVAINYSIRKQGVFKKFAFMGRRRSDCTAADCLQRLIAPVIEGSHCVVSHCVVVIRECVKERHELCPVSHRRESTN